MFSISLSKFISVKEFEGMFSLVKSTVLISVKPLWSCKTIYVKWFKGKEECNFVSEISRISTLFVIVSLRISNLFFKELIFK